VRAELAVTAVEFVELEIRPWVWDAGLFYAPIISDANLKWSKLLTDLSCRDSRWFTECYRCRAAFILCETLRGHIICRKLNRRHSHFVRSVNGMMMFIDNFRGVESQLYQVKTCAAGDKKSADFTRSRAWWADRDIGKLLLFWSDVVVVLEKLLWVQDGEIAEYTPINHNDKVHLSHHHSLIAPFCDTSSRKVLLF